MEINILVASDEIKLYESVIGIMGTVKIVERRVDENGSINLLLKCDYGSSLVYLGRMVEFKKRRISSR